MRNKGRPRRSGRSTVEPLYLAEPLESRRYLSISFQPQLTFAAGSRPQFVAVSDLNGDNKPDLIVANVVDNTVSVLLGYGDGMFEPQVTYAVGMGPTSVAVADVNGDGKRDLVVSNLYGNTVSLLLGNGDGTFKPQQPFAVGSDPSSVALADVNGDGMTDVIVTNSRDNTVSVLLHNDQPNGPLFKPQRTYPAGNNPDSVAVAVNGDGKPDLVVANYNGNTVSVLLGNGDKYGTFQPQESFQVGSHPRSVTVADVNGDGSPDVIVANNNHDTAGIANTVSVLLGNGDGKFNPQQTYAVGTGAASVAVSDVNGDGQPDIVVANYGDNTVSVLLGNGDGTFQTQATIAVGTVPSVDGTKPISVAVSDVNGDGRPDLIVANKGDGYYNGKPSVLLNITPPSLVSILDNEGTLHIGDSYPSDVLTVTSTPESVTVFGNISRISQTFHAAQVFKIDVTLNAGGETFSESGPNKPLVARSNFAGGHNTLQAGGGSETLMASDGGDSIQGGGPNQLLMGGPGNDTITDAAGDTVDGGAGNDSITGNGHDLLKGGPGNDTIDELGRKGVLRGGAGNDLLFPSSLSDTANGNAGNDTLQTGGTSDLLLGGPGDDVFLNGSGSGNTLDGGAGLNFAQVLGNGDSLVNIVEILDPSAVTASAILAPAATMPPNPNDLLGANPLVIDGTVGADSISVTSDAGGNLTVVNDGAVQHPGNVSQFTAILIRGHQGADTLTVDPSVTLPSVLKGGAGGDSLTGGGGLTALIGGGGNDTLVGGGDTNLLIPGPLGFSDHPTGNDVLIGGPTLNNYADFSHRTDATLSLSNDNQADSGDTAAGEATTIMSSVQNIFAGTGTDTVVSTIAGSLLNAGFGNDSLVSGGAGTTLQAGPIGAGADTLQAAGGNNVLFMMNGHVDLYKGNMPTDTLSADIGLDALDMSN